MISTNNYYYEFIRMTKPKVIISFIDITYLFKVNRLFRNQSCCYSKRYKDKIIF